MTRLKDIPVLDRSGRNLDAVMEAVRETLQTYRGYRGDPLDRAITLRDFSPELRAGLGLGGGGGVGGGGGGVGGGGLTPPDPTPPPTPTGLAATAGISTLFITHDVPTYTQGHGHGETVMYGAKWPLSDPTPPVFSEAVLLFQFTGAFAAYPTDPATRWCLWAKWKSNDGYLSTAPAGGTNGVQVTTTQDPAKLKEALTNLITESELFSTLGARIGLIDAPDTTVGSVSARVKAEADARIAAIATEIGLRVAGDASTLAGAQAYTNSYTYSTAGANAAIAASAASLTTAFGAGDAATLTSAQSYTATYAYSRSEADSAIAAAGSTISTAYIAADAATLASANAFTYSRSTIDSAIASSASTLTAAYTSADASTLASANAFTYARATIDAAIASSASTVTASYTSAITAAVATEASARATADGLLQGQWTVKIDLDGYVTGFGLASTAGTATPTSSFIVRSDSFAVASPTGPGITPMVPFIVRTTPGTVNGVPYSAGMYVDGATILDLTAAIARMGTAWIDNAMIGNLSASKLTVGDGTVGGNLKSTTYTAGSGGTPGAGWLMQPNGAVFFQNATVYGTIYAAAGQFAGSLSAATGSFAGSLSAATGTFLGTLQVGSTPALSGTTMTGSGGIINSSGTLALGNSTTNLTFNGSVMTMNGAWVTAANLNLAPLTVTLSSSSINFTGSPTASGSVTVTASASGGTSPYTYTWELTVGSQTGTVSYSTNVYTGPTVFLSASASGAGAAITVYAAVTARDRNGVSGMQTFTLSATESS